MKIPSEYYTILPIHAGKLSCLISRLLVPTNYQSSRTLSLSLCLYSKSASSSQTKNTLKFMTDTQVSQDYAAAIPRKYYFLSKTLVCFPASAITWPCKSFTLTHFSQQSHVSCQPRRVCKHLFGRFLGTTMKGTLMKGNNRHWIWLIMNLGPSASWSD